LSCQLCLTADAPSIRNIGVTSIVIVNISPGILTKKKKTSNESQNSTYACNVKVKPWTTKHATGCSLEESLTWNFRCHSAKKTRIMQTTNKT
jgi:hypothetical protein